jgi:hypothetical protein
MNDERKNDDERRVDCQAADGESESQAGIELSSLIPWAGDAADGPARATPEGKARNRAICEPAIENACACFPPDYCGFLQEPECN